MTSTSLKFLPFELDTHHYIPQFYISANFHFTPFSGDFSPDKWNITVLWLFHSYLVILYFSRVRAKVEPVDGFWRFVAHTTCLRTRTVVLGVATISEFQAKRTEYKNRDILQSIKSINVQFYENVRTMKHKSGVVRYDCNTTLDPSDVRRPSSLGPSTQRARVSLRYVD